MSIPCPLSHLVNLSHKAGLCTKLGTRIPSASWRFNLSALVSDEIVSKTVGFQRVEPSKGVTFLVKKGSLPSSVQMSLTYVTGDYPSETACRQWRMDGLATQNSSPYPSILESAPPASFAQILAAAHHQRQPQHAGNDAFHGGSEGWGLLSDRAAFLKLVDEYKVRLGNGEITMDEIHRDIAVFTLPPERVELCESGEIWERTEWWQDGQNGWNDPLTLLPY